MTSRAEPAAIPGGFWVEVRDPDGQIVRVLDQSTESQAEPTPVG